MLTPSMNLILWNVEVYAPAENLQLARLFDVVLTSGDSINRYLSSLNKPEIRCETP